MAAVVGAAAAVGSDAAVGAGAAVGVEAAGVLHAASVSASSRVGTRRRAVIGVHDGIAGHLTADFERTATLAGARDSLRLALRSAIIAA